MADFAYTNYGSVIALTPLSQAANNAVQDGSIGFESWQVMGGSIMVDHRIMPDLVENLIDDGFDVREEE